jgi:site-specific DNA-methyltransferase (adenine-specific)
VAQMQTLSDCEMAWTSFDANAKIYRHVRNTTEKRIHICQKPVSLYKWTLKNFAKEGDKILDTYLGSGSSRIACYEEGFDFWATEIDKTYFDDQEERFQKYLKQPKPLFTQKDLDNTSQNTLL